MRRSASQKAGISIYEVAVPPRAPFSGLSALSELAAELIEVSNLTSKTLIHNRGTFRRLLGLLRQSKLPKNLELFADHMRKLAQRTQSENLFLDDAGLPLSIHRVDATYETLLKPLSIISYTLIDGALNPPNRVNRERMALVIWKLVMILQELGEGMKQNLSYQAYQRTLHIATRLERAEAVWKRAVEA